MSKSEVSSDATVETTTEEHEKDVIVTAYSENEYESERAFINDLIGDKIDVDLGETKETEERNIKIELNVDGEDDDGYESSVTEDLTPFTGYEQEIVANYFKDKELPEFLSITDEVVTEKEFKHSPRIELRNHLRAQLEEGLLSDSDYEESGYTNFVRSWARKIEDLSVDADPDDTIKQYSRVVTKSTIEPTRPLVHQSKRTRENRYESEDELWSFKIKAHIEATSADEMQELSEAIVSPIYRELWEIDGVDLVRIESCEQAVKKSGECYNI